MRIYLIISNLISGFYLKQSTQLIYQTMKYWLSHLPLEVWVDCYRYPGISREQMGQIVDLIGNHKYGEYLQFYLHDWGKRSLKPIYFYKQNPRKKKPKHNWRPYMHVPQTPMPLNIRSFECIKISHFDQQTIDFLHRIQPLLLADLKLKLDDITSSNLDNLRVILDHMLPLLDGNYSLNCCVRALPTVGQSFGEKLAKIKTLVCHEGLEEFVMVIYEEMQQSTINFLMNWLTSSQQQEGNAGERCGFVNLFMDIGFSKQISAAIREEFLAAKTPKTFTLVVGFVFFDDEEEFAEFHLKNGIGEELHGVTFDQGGRIQFTRQKANCGADVQDCLKENISKIDINHSEYRRQNQIEISKPTVGLFDAMDAPVDVEEEDDNDKAFTSKEANNA